MDIVHKLRKPIPCEKHITFLNSKNQYHRINGPAIIIERIITEWIEHLGNLKYWQNGKRHRTNGPFPRLYIKAVNYNIIYMICSIELMSPRGYRSRKNVSKYYICGTEYSYDMYIELGYVGGGNLLLIKNQIVEELRFII